MFEHKDIHIHWLGNAGFKIKTRSKVIYIDPYQIKETEKANYVFLTHSHQDHLSLEDLQKVVDENTVIVCSVDCLEQLGELPSNNIEPMEPFKSLDLLGVKVETTPAYNLGKKFHPEGNSWLGFVIELENIRIFHSGDTDVLEELKKVECDIALLPVSGTYVMNAEEAAELANTIQPKVAVIPMHYGSVVGTTEDAEKFKSLCKGNVVILEKE